MPTGPIVLVFGVVFAVVFGVFWLLVQRPEQKSTQALRRRLKGEVEEVEAEAPGDALIERPKRDRRRLEGIAASAGGGVLRYLAVQIERADMDMPPGRLLMIAAAVGAAGALLLAWMSPLWLITVPLGLAGAWLPIGPSRVPFSDSYPTPSEASITDLAVLRAAFRAAAQRALAAGMFEHVQQVA